MALPQPSSMAEELPRPTGPRRLDAVVAAESPLTAYVREISTRREPGGADFERFWDAFSSRVRLELTRRGLAETPPRHLGIDAQRWDRAALEELSCECYAFLLQRLRGLVRQLRLKANIDGLIVLNIRHCLHERQKRNDPLGFRVYEMTHCAVRRALRTGELRITSGNPRVDNRTVLSLPAGSATQPEGGPPQPGGETDPLVEFARSVSDELVPDLVTARGSRKERMLERLRARLAGLAASGVPDFTFKQLVDACKKAVRVRWSAIWVGDQGETGEDFDREWKTLVPIVQPNLDYDQRQSWERLTDCVADHLEQLPADEVHRDHLEVLWQFLSSQAPDPAQATLPSRRKIAELLGVPRYLLPELFTRLGQIIRICRATVRRPPSRQPQPTRASTTRFDTGGQ